ncbi:hypothetical protein [Amycolatopsis aidingensis]|uniref:hypothetical protein n=1 Tax=Amycolatopsis aidingensis TaxID=2842453 RepID=UPI001C0C69AE|nr:hypothetical protein [Amycolatopsis aidingensis]
MSDPLWMVRFRPGVVGERWRMVHLVPVPDPAAVPVTVGDCVRVLVALCGQQFAPGEAERLSRPAGAPCEVCLALLERASIEGG